MRITIDGLTHDWNGSHTVNVYDASGVNVDVWTLFPTDGRKPSQLDVLSALITREDH